MVFCPKCGKEFPDDAKICDICGENLREETSFKKILKITQYLGFILLVLWLGYTFLSSKLNILPFVWELWVLILVLSIIFITTRRFVLSFFLFFLFGRGKRTTCPKCEELVPEENYCLNCGYNLSNVVGYFQIGSSIQPTFIELNKNYIRVFETLREHNYLTRLPPTTYSLDRIDTPEITWCEGRVLTYPCLKFDYGSKKVKIIINKKIASHLNQIFPNISGYESVARFGVWLGKQNKRKIGIIAALCLLIFLSFYMVTTAKTDITYISASSQIPDLIVLNSTGYRPLIGSNNVVIEGYVQNKGNKELSFVELNATGFDSSGDFVVMDYTYADLETIPAGGISYFKIYLDDPQKKVVSYKLEVYL